MVGDETSWWRDDRYQIVTQVVICYTNIVANGSFCCFFIRIQGCICHNMEGHAVSFDTVSRDAQTPNFVGKSNVSKFYAGQVVSLINEQPSQNLLPKIDPLSSIRNNELIAKGEELETSAKLRG